MKKEASVILAKCAQDKLYGIRIEKRDNDWVRTWAFKLKEETKVPLPIALYTYPSFSNNSYTFTIVALFTFIKSDNFLIGGSFSCSFISPLKINFFI